MYCVTGYPEARICLTSSDFSVSYPFRVSRQVLGETLLDLDGPTHYRLRRLLARLLQGRAQNSAFADVVDVWVPRVLAALPTDRDIEFVSAVAEPIPMAVTAGFLGIPDELIPQTRELLHYLLFHLDGSRGSSSRATEAREELHALLRRLLPGPGEGSMLDQLGAWEADGTLAIEEALGLATLTLAAGVETSTGLLANAMVCLATHPEYRLALGEDAARKAFVREVLRWEPPQHDTVRFAVRPTSLGDVPIPAGAALKVLLASANRDERVFDRAADFDPQRADRPSLTFGHGAHSCLGTHLATHVAERTFQHMLARFPDLAVVDHPIPLITGSTFRRPERLHVLIRRGAGDPVFDEGDGRV